MIGYVPPGHLTVYDAVGRLAALWHPKISPKVPASEVDPLLADLARSFAAEKEKVDGPRRERQERLETYARLRRVLAEGLLPSIIIAKSDGKRWRLPAAFWASSQANTDAGVSAVISYPIGGVLVSGTPLVEERDIAAIAVGDPPPSLLEVISRRAAAGEVAEPRKAAAVETPSAETVENRNLGGRPPKIDWDGFWIKIATIANHPDGLPPRPELRRMLSQWIEDAGQTMSDTMLNEKLAKLYDSPKRKPVSGG